MDVPRHPRQSGRVFALDHLRLSVIAPLVKFRTSSDAEVLLQAPMRRGLDARYRVSGMPNIVSGETAILSVKLETHCPFLDQRLVLPCLATSTDLLFRSASSKWVHSALV